MPNYFNFAKKFAQLVSTKKTDSDYKKLEEYGIIGNVETSALIASDGSIDWLCLPHLESGSVFGRLLDKNKGGFFSVQPKLEFQTKQKYIENTNVLQTLFKTESGEATLTDFMPPFKKRTIWHKHHTLFRKILCVKGVISFTVSFQPRFNYARDKTKLKATETGILAQAGDKKIYLDSSSPFEICGAEAVTHFTLGKNEELWFVMQYNSREHFSLKDLNKELKQTVKFWQGWAHKCERDKCPFNGPWHDLIVRSGLVLKLLTHGATGAIAAAATTSLPENLGGVRNWDYRFNWIRDSVFTAQALYNLGHLKEAKELMNWYKRLYKGVKVQDVQIMYGLHGEKDLKEKILRNLSGYKNSKPVRIGNAAAKQKQLDIYGELLSMAYEISKYGESISKNEWRMLKKTINHVCRIWKNKDAGIWEVRGGYKHFVYSKIMCWVALDRGIKIAQKRSFKAPIEGWIKTRDKIKQTILKKGFNKKLNSFTQSFGSENLDAANLLIPLMGFLPFTDSKVKGTITATLKYLTKKNLVYRYKSRDGLPGEEGTFVLCTFWLVDVLALSGHVEKAEKILLNLLKHISPLGLFAEEIDPKTGLQQGNIPQAFSHVGLINSALYINLAKGKKSKKTKLFGDMVNKILNPFNLIKF